MMTLEAENVDVRKTWDQETAVAHIGLAGELDGATAGDLRDAVLSTLARNRPAQLLVDMGEVTFLDSTAIGVLVSAHQAAVSAGARLTLEHASPFAERVLWISGVASLFGLTTMPSSVTD